MSQPSKLITTIEQLRKTWHPLQLLILTLSTWAVTYSRLALGPLQEALRVDLSLSDNQIALLQGPALALPIAIGAIPLGLLVDRYSRARILLIFAVLNLVACVLSAYASSFAMLLVARCLLGLSVSAILITAYSIVGDLYAPAMRGRATMVVAMGEVGGAPSAFAIGGLLLVFVGSAAAGWRPALLWMCVPLIFVVLLALAAIDQPRAYGVDGNPPLIDVWPKLWRFRGIVLPLLLARIMMWVSDGAVSVWAISAFSRTFAVSAEYVSGMIATAMLIGGLSGPLLAGLIADYCQRTGGPRRTVSALIALALLSAPAALFAVVANVSWASVLLTLFLTLGSTFGVAAMALTTIVVPSEVRGLFIAITVTAGALFSIGFAPLAVSGLSVALGGPAMIMQALGIVCGGTSLLGAVIFILGRRHFPSGESVVGRSHRGNWIEQSSS